MTAETPAPVPTSPSPAPIPISSRLRPTVAVATRYILIAFVLFFASLIAIQYLVLENDNLTFSSIAAAVTITNDAPLPEKVVVIASRKADDTSWLKRRLPDWDVKRYVVDDPSAEFTVPLNKGRESMVYLTYLIDCYDRLPDVTVFMHSLQYQWHNDDPNHDGATTLSRLQLPYVQASGYVNMRCVWVLGCPAEIRPNEVRPDSKDSEKVFRSAFLELLPAGLNHTVVPDVIGTSCCAQFAVSRAKVREKPRSEYMRLREWLIKTELEDALSGRVFEYSWHMVFGQPPVHCPNAQSCYCNVFGLCDLEGCTESACEGRYTLPTVADMPADWKELPEYD